MLATELPESLDIMYGNEEIGVDFDLWLSRQLRDKFSGSQGKHLCVTKNK